MANPKLNQILAIEKGVKQRVYGEFTELHHATQKSPLMNGFHKAYQPKREDGESYPPESQRVQHVYTEVIEKVQKQLTELFDITATKDWANCTARADIVIDGQVQFREVPATYLLFLEKQLSDLHTFVEKMTELDPGVEWQKDPASGMFKSEPAITQRTKKEQRPIVLYDATDKHPAQTQLITDDVIVGHWTTVKHSGAIPATEKKVYLTRIQTLLNAVKFAREQANMAETNRQEIGAKLLNYVFRTT